MKIWNDSGEEENAIWNKPNKMYHPWLLIEDTSRKDFDLELHKERFRQWEALMEEKFRKNC